MFSVGTMVAAMALAREDSAGLALGAWGAVHASATGFAIMFGGVLRDVVGHVAATDGLGTALAGRATGYSAVYLLEILLLLGTLIVLGPLVGRGRSTRSGGGFDRFGLTEFPT